MPRLPAIALLLLVLGAAGCGRESDATTARAVTDTFFAALDADDGERACAQLTPATRAALESQEQTSCREAIAGLDLQGATVARVQVFVTNSLVELTNGETAFLDYGERGWRLSAVGCTSVGKPADRPFDCELEA
jgi:hypothetical protein